MCTTSYCAAIDLALVLLVVLSITLGFAAGHDRRRKSR